MSRNKQELLDCLPQPTSHTFQDLQDDSKFDPVKLVRELFQHELKCVDQNTGERATQQEKQICTVILHCASMAAGLAKKQNAKRIRKWAGIAAIAWFFLLLDCVLSLLLRR